MLFSNSVKRKSIVERSSINEKDVPKFNDSLEIDQEKRSRNFIMLNDNLSKKENHREIEKMMKTYEINSLKRVHSSLGFGLQTKKIFEKC